jgi:hypothetical protein
MVLIFNQAFVVEFVGSEALVVASDGAAAYRLSPELTAVVRKVQAGKPVDSRSAEVAELLDLGVIQSSPAGVSRRSVVTGTAATIGGAVIALSIPGVAAASSGGGMDDDGDPFTIQGFYLPEDGVTYQEQYFSIRKSDVVGTPGTLTLSTGVGTTPVSDGDFWTATFRNFRYTGTMTGTFDADGETYTVTFTPQQS